MGGGRGSGWARENFSGWLRVEPGQIMGYCWSLKTG